MNFSYQKGQVLVFRKTEDLVTSAATLPLALLSLSVFAYEGLGPNFFHVNFQYLKKIFRGFYSFIWLLMFSNSFSGGVEKRIENFHDIYIFECFKSSHQFCSIKKFLKISQYSQENTRVRVSFQ